MNPDLIFQLSGAMAMIGWLLLIFVSRLWWQTTRWVAGIIVSMLCIIYACLIGTAFSLVDMGSFGSLDGVMVLFGNKMMVTAGWVHYLAFDLMIGNWIVRNAFQYQIPHLLVVPLLLLTFMLGPIGLLAYFGLRWFITKNYFVENFR